MLIKLVNHSYKRITLTKGKKILSGFYSTNMRASTIALLLINKVNEQWLGTQKHDKHWTYYKNTPFGMCWFRYESGITLLQCSIKPNQCLFYLETLPKLAIPSLIYWFLGS